MPSQEDIEKLPPHLGSPTQALYDSRLDEVAETIKKRIVNPAHPAVLYPPGTVVVKLNTDYFFKGTVVSLFMDLGGRPRYAVENQDGLILIFRPHELVESRIVPPDKELTARIMSQVEQTNPVPEPKA